VAKGVSTNDSNFVLLPVSFHQVREAISGDVLPNFIKTHLRKEKYCEKEYTRQQHEFPMNQVREKSAIFFVAITFQNSVDEAWLMCHLKNDKLS
jgi:hypothetical protein